MMCSLVITLAGETLSFCCLMMAVQMNGRISTDCNRGCLSLEVCGYDHSTLFSKVFLQASAVLELFKYVLLLSNANLLFLILT